MDFSITITLFVQAIQSILGLYILGRFYIGPVVQELMAEDLLAQQLEAQITVEKQRIEKEKEQQSLYVLQQHTNLQAQLQEDTVILQESSIDVHLEKIELPKPEETIDLFTAALIDEVKLP